MLRSSTFAALFLLAAAVGCTADDTVDEVEASLEPDAKADASSELSVRAGDTTLWVGKALVRREGDGGPEYVLRGRTSRNLVDGSTYIFDDVYGEYLARGPRSFDDRWVIRSNAGPLLEGRQQFVSLTFVHSATRPDHLTARAVVRPRLEAFSGSTKVFLTAEVTPIVYDRQVVYRLAGRTTGAFTTVAATGAGAPLTARAVDATHFVVDLTQAQLVALAGVGGADLSVTVTLGGATLTKRARVGLAVKALGLTSGDAYETWPEPTCTAELQACLAALPATAVDLSSCGDAVTVRACRR